MCNAWNHPADCDCGFGGDTYVAYAPSPRSYVWQYRDDDPSHPTTCPHCGALVYFVRHNGGCAWFDELGIPWPKHACFYEDAVTVGTSKAIEAHPPAVVGYVIEVEGTDGAPTGVIKVRCLDSSVISGSYQTSHLVLSTLPGRLVIIEDRPGTGRVLTFPSTQPTGGTAA